MSNGSPKGTDGAQEGLEARTQRCLVLLIDKSGPRANSIKELLLNKGYIVVHERQMLGPIMGPREPNIVITSLEEGAFNDVEKAREYYPKVPVLATVQANSFSTDLVTKATPHNIQGWIALENGPDKKSIFSSEGARTSFLERVQQVLERGYVTPSKLDYTEDMLLKVLEDDPTSIAAQAVLARHYIHNRELWGAKSEFTGRFRNDVWRFTAGNFVGKVGPEEHKLELEREAKFYGVLKDVNEIVKRRLATEIVHRQELGKTQATVVSAIEQRLAEGDFIPTVELLSSSPTAIGEGRDARHVLITRSGGKTLNKVLEELYDKRATGETKAGEEADKMIEQLLGYAARIYAAHKLVFTRAPTNLVEKVVTMTERNKNSAYYIERVKWKFIGKYGSGKLFGGSLYAMLRDKPFRDELMGLFRQRGRPLVNLLARAQPAIEMDISPFNAVVDANGKVRLLDFGSVKNDGHWYTVGNILAATGFEPVFVPGQHIVNQKRLDYLLKFYIGKVEDEARFIDPDLAISVKTQNGKQTKEAYAFAIHRALTYAGNFFLWSGWTDKERNFGYGVQCVEAAQQVTRMLSQAVGISTEEKNDLETLYEKFFQPVLDRLRPLEQQRYKGLK